MNREIKNSTNSRFDLFYVVENAIFNGEKRRSVTVNITVASRPATQNVANCKAEEESI
jgi:hypothetical protein